MYTYPSLIKSRRRNRVFLSDRNEYLSKYWQLLQPFKEHRCEFNLNLSKIRKKKNFESLNR